MRRAVFRYIEAELYDYPLLKREICALREDIIDSEDRPSVYGKRPDNRPGDPTGHKGLRLLTNRRLKRMEETVRAISSVVDRLPPEKKRLIELKYWDGRYTDTGVIGQLHISRRTYFYWRRQIVEAIAVEMGLAERAG